MLEQLRAWLNGKREYYAGVALLAEAGGAANLLAVLTKGPTPFSVDRLYKELLHICNNLKSNSDVRQPTLLHGQEENRGATSQESSGSQAVLGRSPGTENLPPANPALYESCRQEALKIYKTAMNDRAILFSQVRNLSTEEVNLPHHIAARAALAIAVVRNFNLASELFDRADFVKQNGRLPDGPGEEAPEVAYDTLPDDLVYPTLTNLRKALSKLKKKEPTPERLALQQQHSANIQKLEGRWRLLKGK
jgi:hypothetical protein